MSPDAPRSVFPFFVGCPRSGTTLLRAIFDSHSQLAVPGESHFVARMALRRERYERNGSVAETFLDELLADEQFQRWHLPGDLVRESFATLRPASFPDAVRTVFGVYATHQGKPLYGDKTPGFVRLLPQLARLFPEARFVHLVRDGRDVVLSLRELDWAQRGGGLEALAEFWRTNVERGFAAGEQLGPGCYREVRYEQLLEQPESTVAGVCAFLGIPYEPAMLAYYKRAHELAPSLRREREHRSLHLPPTKRLRDWQREMTQAELARFESVAGETLERAGYSRAGSR